MPNRPWRRLREQPFEGALGVALVVFSAAGVFDSRTTPASIATLPNVLTIVFLVTAAVAGLCTVVGLALPRRRWGLPLEHLGLWLGAATWCVYAYGLASTGTIRSTLLCLVLLAIAFASIARSYQAHREEQALLQQVVRRRREEVGGP